MKLANDRWTEVSHNKSNSPPLRRVKSFIHCGHECLRVEDSFTTTTTSQHCGDRWTRTSEIFMSNTPLWRCKSFNHHGEDNKEEDPPLVQLDEDLCRWKDSHIKSLAPPRPPRRHSEI
jgi:hypothetical protein